MITIRDLQEQITGEFQGNVIVKQWNDEKGELDVDTLIDCLSVYDPIWDKPIKFMYSDTYINEPVLCIEVDGDYA